jgi:hypothetical protein
VLLVEMAIGPLLAIGAAKYKPPFFSLQVRAEVRACTCHDKGSHGSASVPANQIESLDARHLREYTP